MKYLTTITAVLIISAFCDRLLAQDAENVEQVGRIYNHWGMIREVVVVNNLAYVATTESGLQILDVSEPDNPEIIGHWDYITYAYCLAVSGEIAYVGNWYGGLHIVSIANPEQPEEVGFIETHDRFTDVKIYMDFAYILDDRRGFTIVNISDPVAPIEIGSMDAEWRSLKMEISGNHAFIASSYDGFRVISLVDPENPQEVGFIDEREGRPYDVAISGDYAYVVSYEGSLSIVSISDLENPVEVGNYDVWGPFAGIDVFDDYAYVADSRDGLRIISIADPENPEEVGHYDEYGAYWITKYGDFVFVSANNYFASGGDVGLRILSVSDPENPEEVGAHHAPGFANNLHLSNNLAYMSDGLNGLRIISIADPEQPEEVGYFDTPGELRDVAVFGNKAYLAESIVGLDEEDIVGGLRVISIDDPANIEEIGFTGITWGAQAVLVDSFYAFVAHQGLSIYSIANLALIRQIGRVRTQGYTYGIAISGDYAYLANIRERVMGQWVGWGLYIINISDPENPSLESYLNTEENVWDVSVLGEYAYLAVADSGLRVISIVDVEHPVEVGKYEFGGIAYDVVVSENKAYVAAGNKAYNAPESIGLHVISISNPEEPEGIGYFETPGSAFGVSLSEDGHIYVADGTNMGIYLFTDPNAVADPAITTPEKYKLYAAYPNPFNAQTRIAYDLPASANVKLSILDINGRTVDVLDQGMKSSGQHRLIWDGLGNVSGTYFVRLDAGGMVINRKAVLIK